MNKNLLKALLITSIVLISTSNLFAQNHTVNITEFTVSAKAQKVMIDWKTDGTTATNYFAIQKSTDGVNYKTMAIVMGPDPKQNNCDCYGCADKYVPGSKGHAYYRLIHIDNDGNEQITEAKGLAKS